MDGDRYFISINITKYDDPNLERKGAEKNAEKLNETFQNGVDILNDITGFNNQNKIDFVSKNKIPIVVM